MHSVAVAGIVGSKHKDAVTKPKLSVNYFALFFGYKERRETKGTSKPFDGGGRITVAER